MSTDCPLCVSVQSIAESALVRDAIEKGELSIETMLTGMRDSMVLGWVLRDMQGGASESKQFIRSHIELCEEHAAQVNELSKEDE
jgi:hypothetical protein